MKRDLLPNRYGTDLRVDTVGLHKNAIILSFDRSHPIDRPIVSFCCGAWLCWNLLLFSHQNALQERTVDCPGERDWSIETTLWQYYELRVVHSFPHVFTHIQARGIRFWGRTRELEGAVAGWSYPCCEFSLLAFPTVRTKRIRPHALPLRSTLQWY